VPGVFSVARSPDGYLRLASNAGVLRFDGVRFPCARQHRGPLLQNRDGTLWVWGDGLQTLRQRHWARFRLACVRGTSGHRQLRRGRGNDVWIATLGQGLIHCGSGRAEQIAR
jgi:hypothetical protein